MAISSDLIMTGLVTSSIFLVALSIPQILIALIAVKMRTWLLTAIIGGVENEFVQGIKRYFSERMVKKWAQPDIRIKLLNGDLSKLVNLFPAYIEGLTAAGILTFLSVSYGFEPEMQIAVIVIVFIVVFISIVGCLMAGRLSQTLRKMLEESKVKCDSSTPCHPSPGPQDPERRGSTDDVSGRGSDGRIAELQDGRQRR